MNGKFGAGVEQARREQAGHWIGYDAFEWHTLGLIFGCYAVWLGAGALYSWSGPVAFGLLTLTIVLHSSLQHEAIHRHPTRSAAWNEALVFLPLGLLMPFRRYRDLHIQHHRGLLTDPHDDPESFYLSAGDYRRLPAVARRLYDWNNTLVGRLLIGPAISTAGLLVREWRLARQLHGEDARAFLVAWGLHALGLAMVAALVHFVFQMPAYAYLGAAYVAMSVLAIRSFIEHQWAETEYGRTVIVERSRIGLLFLNNSLHLVHHREPELAWYELPAAYEARRDEWHALNGGYVFEGYREVLRAFALRRKEPVPHPARSD